jgi:uncharacterized protein (TIGR03000 family)
MFCKYFSSGSNHPDGSLGVPFAKKAVLAAVGLLLAIGQGLAGEGMKAATRSSYYPWYAPGYRGYKESRPVTRPSNPPVRPQKYWLYVSTLPVKNTKKPRVAELLVHVPENAEVWLQDVKLSKKRTHHRHFVSPPLDPNMNYVYTVRVNWIEDGKWVSQTHHFAVVAGTIHCIYLMKSHASLEPKTAVAKNLAKLSPEDGKLAKAQKYCAVQDRIKLGAMGVPVKVMLKGKPVFLCCSACRKRADSNPEGALARAKELKARFHKKARGKKLGAKRSERPEKGKKHP